MDRRSASGRVARALRLLALAALAPACGSDAPAAGSPAATGPPIEPRLSVLNEEIFVPSCALSKSCHFGSAPKEGLDLSGAIWSRIVNRPSAQLPERKLVVPGDPDASYLYEKVSRPMPARGVRMPNTSPPLEPRALDALRAWIAAGAKDD
jgi:hypothetical protein